MAGQPGFFDLDERHAALSAAGIRSSGGGGGQARAFRAELEAALERSDRASGGWPPYDAVVICKILVLQTR
jgi:IS5 family transposase